MTLWVTLAVLFGFLYRLCECEGITRKTLAHLVRRIMIAAPYGEVRAMPQNNARPKFVVLDGATMQPLPSGKRRRGRLTLFLMGSLATIWMILELGEVVIL